MESRKYPPSLTSTIQKADLFVIPFEEAATASSMDSKNDPFLHRGKERVSSCEDSGNISVTVAAQYCQNKQLIQPQPKQCRDKDGNRWTLCKLNREATAGEYDWFTTCKAKANASEETVSSPNVPCCREIPEMQPLQHHRSVINFDEDQYRDLHVERIMLPPKKRICLNMELTAAECEDPRLKIRKDESMASTVANPVTNISDVIASSDTLPKNEQQAIEHAAQNSRCSLSNETAAAGGSDKDFMGPSKSFLRRYKLLSKIA